jgi:hypothetical protein
VTRAAVAAYAAVLVGLAVLMGPLGHDEAQYAIGGAALLGRAVSAFPLHRPVGMQVVAAPGVLVGGGDLGFHLTAAAWTLAMLGASYIYVRRAHGARTAAWATAVVATSFAVLRRGPEMLPDAPSAVFVLAFAAGLVGGLAPNADPARRWRLAWLGPLAAAAFYLRYGSIGVLATISASALAVWWRQVRACLAPLAVAALSAAALAAPHVVQSVRATGSVLGILQQASVAAGRGYRGDGLVYYGTTWWLWLGPVASVCAACGLIAAAARRDAVTLFAGLAALAALVLVGLDAHGEARYVLVPQVLLIGAGVDAIRAWAMPRTRLAAALVAASLVGSSIAAAIALLRARRTFGVVAAAGGEVRRAAGGAPCTVIAGKWPQAEWYSGCEGVQPPDAIEPAAITGQPTFLIWFDDGTRQPPSLLAQVEAGRGGVRAIEIAHVDAGGGAWGGARVFRLQASP